MGKLNIRSLRAIIFGLYSIGCLLIYDDYGLNMDESIERKHGVITFNYILKKLGLADNVQNSNLYDLSQYDHKDYGSIFQLVSYTIENALQIKTTKGIFLLRHILVLALFIFALASYMNSIGMTFRDPLFQVLGLVLIVTCPRIFADSFYNVKDLVFLSITIFSLNTFLIALKTPSFKSLLVHSLTSGLLIGTRIMGLYIVVLSAALFALPEDSDKGDFFLSIRNGIRRAIFYSSMSVFFTYIFWPAIWESPAENLIQAFENMKQFRWYGSVLFLGEYYEASKLPWYYAPVWIGITIPVSYWLLTLLGIWQICVANLKKGMFDKTQMFIVMGFITPLIAVVIFESTLYNGWRHLYFVCPFLILLALYGLQFVIDKVIDRYGRALRLVASGIIIFVLAEFVETIWFMVKYHPYQYAYFNILGSTKMDAFESDYYGICHKDALRYILDQEKLSDSVAVCSLSLAGQMNRFYFDERDYSKIVYTDLENCKYFITSPYLNSEENEKYRKEEFPYDRKQEFAVRVRGSDLVIVYRLK